MGPDRDALVALHQILSERFSDSELRTLCFDLGVQYEDLPGESKPDKARELVTYLAHRNELADLLRVGQTARPDIAWPALTQRAVTPPSAGSAVPHAPEAGPAAVRPRMGVPPWLLAMAGVLIVVGIILAARQGLAPNTASPQLPGSSASQTPSVSSAVPPATSVIPAAATLTVPKLEQRLRAANIILNAGTEQDIARVRGYLTDLPEWRALAASCLQVLGTRRVKQPLELDTLETWYGYLVTGTSGGHAQRMDDYEKLRQAMVAHWNERYGDNVATFEDILEPMQ